MSLSEAVVLFAAAVLAGVVNSFAGGGSLISFPALVWAGIDPVVANATNTVAISPGAFAAMLPFRREVREMAAWVALLGPASVVGGALGAYLLLATPERVFAAMVPWLVLFATGVFALQEAVSRRAVRGERAGLGRLAPARRASRRRARTSAVALAFQLAIAVYGGYFGAGIGIMMLAALGFLGITDLHRMLGLRSFLGLCVNGVAALCFAANGTVDWPAAAVMVFGQILGSYGGAAVVRRLPRVAVRRSVVAIGAAMAIALFLTMR